MCVETIEKLKVCPSDAINPNPQYLIPEFRFDNDKSHEGTQHTNGRTFLSLIMRERERSHHVDKEQATRIKKSCF